MKKAHIGVDPGLKGALALLAEDNTLLVEDMPVLVLQRNGKDKGQVDKYQLGRIVDRWCSEFQIVRAVIEQVGARPKESPVASFSFGRSVGCVEQAIASCFVPTEMVVPTKWKRAMRITADKDGARARASALMPRYNSLWTRVKDDGRAEAALMAVYCREFL